MRYTTNLLLTGIFGVLMLLFVALTFYIFRMEKNYIKKCLLAPGVVIDLYESTDKDGVTYFPVVEYNVEGRDYHLRGNGGSNPPSYHVGEKVEVYYKPSNPKDSQIKGFWSQWLFTVLLSFFAFLFSIFTFVFGFKYKKQLDANPI